MSHFFLHRKQQFAISKTRQHEFPAALRSVHQPHSHPIRQRRKEVFISSLQELLSCLSSKRVGATLPWTRLHFGSQQRMIDFTRLPVEEEPFGHRGHGKCVMIIKLSSVVIMQKQGREEAVWDIWCGRKKKSLGHYWYLNIGAVFSRRVLPCFTLSVGRNYNTIWIIDEVLFWWCKLVLMQKIIFIVCINGIFSAEMNPN